MRRYQEPCTPPPWARGGHAQTLLSHLLPAFAPRICAANGFEPREVELDDGERLLAFGRAGTTGVRVLLFHGLSGDVNAEYMRGSVQALVARGHDVWAVNHRGCGEGRGLALRPYHSGVSGDLAAVLRASRASDPELVQVVIGFSLSGNVALLHAAQRLAPQPAGLIAVNPPVDLERASTDLGRGWSRLYELRFMWRLRRAMREREAAGWVGRRDYRVLLRMTLREFDDHFTAPECGFADGMDYYRRCSSLPHLAELATPAVVLTAADDPFVDPAVYAGARLSPAVLLHVEPSGGHVGYLARRGPGWTRWLDGALAHYVDELAAGARSRRP